jgi:diketogulonate reductase-like aldo/keto reductase
MRTAPFGPARVEVPLLGQGTWNLERASEREAVAALQAGIAAGMTHIDTAELYGSGRAERIVRRAIEGRRNGLFLVSKVLPSNASHKKTIEACERSLERLGTDYLDVYLLHWRGSYPLAETFRAFDDLQTAGKIRAYGVSNFDVDDLEEAFGIVGAVRIAFNQVIDHLAERSIEHVLIPWCGRNGDGGVAYSPLGSGNFPSTASAGGKVLARIAGNRGLSPYQIALAFLVQQAGVFAIPKASSAGHALDNAAVGDLELTPTEMRDIDVAFPPGRRRGLAML